MAQYNVETDGVKEKHEQVNLHNSDGQENVYHLKITDITSGDSKVLVPSSNAEIAGKMNIHGNVSDTTFDESMKTVQSVQQLVHEHSSDECTRNGTEVKDTVVQSSIVNGTNEKIHVESDQSRRDAKEDNRVPVATISPINPDVTETQSTMEVSAHYMGTDNSSYKESDGVTSESRETNLSLQYLTDEGKYNILYTI